MAAILAMSCTRLCTKKHLAFPGHLPLHRLGHGLGGEVGHVGLDGLAVGRGGVDDAKIP